jgi:IS605 OrfB family transposase
LVQAARTDALAKIKAAVRSGHKITAAPKLKNVTLRYDTRTSAIRGSQVALAVCGGGRIKTTFGVYPKLVEYAGKYRMLSPALYYSAGQFWLVLHFEVPDIAPMARSVVGIDVGQRNFAATSEGKLYKNRPLNKSRRQIRFLKQKLQKRGTKSARQKLRKLRFKERRQSDNAIHCLSKQILKETNAAFIAVEKLKLPTSKWSKSKNRRRYAAPISKLVQFLNYKSLQYGKRVVSVNPYMTSRNDCRGFGNGTREKGKYTGIDGKILNADINAACNIAWKAAQIHGLNNPIVPQGYDRQADVTQPIACKSLSCATHKLMSCNSLAS